MTFSTRQLHRHSCGWNVLIVIST